MIMMMVHFSETRRKQLYMYYI